RLQLREGAEVRSARLRPGPDSLSGGAQRTQGRRTLQAPSVGRSARARRLEIQEREGRARRRIDPAVLLRWIERTADAGQHRRTAVAALRHIEAGAHGLRRADRRGQYGPLPQYAVDRLSG